MWRAPLLLILVLCTSLLPARDKVENWIEVRSPHFIVATNSDEKQARRLADQFERMRSVFHVLFPKLNIDPSSPVIVLAVKNEKDFRALEPETYLAKGQLKLGGLFLRAADKNYVLLRLDAEGEHPYAVVYHEYMHLLLSKDAEFLPLWLNEGLAEFYQTIDIKDKDALLGLPSAEDIYFLRTQRLLALPTLFAVDHNSPYYHEENKGSIFYAESWALTHYLLQKDDRENTQHVKDYIGQLAKKADPISAANAAFGDLKQLEKALNSYIQQTAFPYIKTPNKTEVDDSAFKMESLTPPQTDALRADFLAYNKRSKDAKALLDQVLQEDPKNTSAYETMGFLEAEQGHFEEAKKWYARAVQLDSQSYLAHYYYAAISLREAMGESAEPQIEASLRKAIQLNPSFAPAFDSLAMCLSGQRSNLDEAHMMGLTAISLDPGNVGYRINVANILLRMERGQNAVEVLRYAAKLAKTPQESQWVDNMLMHAQEYAEEQKQMAEQKKRMDEEGADSRVARVAQNVSSSAPEAPRLMHREFVPAGPHRFFTGQLQDVHCESSNMDLSVKSPGKTIPLHSDNYFRLQFSALGFTPSAELKPCTDLEGRPAKVEYVESADKSAPARLISIELHK
jgi:Tfp pilus assembly protein PilF